MFSGFLCALLRNERSLSSICFWGDFGSNHNNNAILGSNRWKFGSKTEDQRWRRSWKTASFPRNTAPAPATPWPATLHSPRPSGTHRVPPGRTVYSHKASTRRLLTFWKTRGHGTLQPAAPWLPTCRPLTQYSIRWLLERGRYIEKKKERKLH